MRWIIIEDLEPDRPYQFWVTAVTSAGEGMTSMVVTETPSSRGIFTKIFKKITFSKTNVILHYSAG